MPRIKIVPEGFSSNDLFILGRAFALTLKHRKDLPPDLIKACQRFEECSFTGELPAHVSDSEYMLFGHALSYMYYSDEPESQVCRDLLEKFYDDSMVYKFLQTYKSKD